MYTICTHTLSFTLTHTHLHTHTHAHTHTHTHTHTHIHTNIHTLPPSLPFSLSLSLSLSLYVYIYISRALSLSFSGNDLSFLGLDDDDGGGRPKISKKKQGKKQGKKGKGGADTDISGNMDGMSVDAEAEEEAPKAKGRPSAGRVRIDTNVQALILKSPFYVPLCSKCGRALTFQNVACSLDTCALP